VAGAVYVGDVDFGAGAVGAVAGTVDPAIFVQRFSLEE
jgi:hypothetical protein